jgi:hypothetical protein
LTIKIVPYVYIGDEDETDPLFLDEEKGFSGLESSELKELDYELDEFDSGKEVEEAMKSQKNIDYIMKDWKGPLTGLSDIRNSPHNLSIIVPGNMYKNGGKNIGILKSPRISPKKDQISPKNSPQKPALKIPKYTQEEKSEKMDLKNISSMNYKSMKNNSNILSAASTTNSDDEYNKNEKTSKISPINALMKNDQKNDQKNDIENGWGEDLHKYQKINIQDSHKINNENYRKKEKIYKSSNYLINWVKFDEEFLKPLFGGSFRDYDEKEASHEEGVANYHSIDN